MEIRRREAARLRSLVDQREKQERDKVQRRNDFVDDRGASGRRVHDSAERRPGDGCKLPERRPPGDRVAEMLRTHEPGQHGLVGGTLERARRSNSDEDRIDEEKVRVARSRERVERQALRASAPLHAIKMRRRSNQSAACPVTRARPTAGKNNASPTQARSRGRPVKA